MQLIRGFERCHRAPGATVGKEHALQHLVASVRDEHVLGTHLVQGGDGTAKFSRGAVGVPIPADVTHGCSEIANEFRGRLDRRLVGVEPYRHRHLRRVVPGHRTQIIALGVPIHVTRLLMHVLRTSVRIGFRALHNGARGVFQRAVRTARCNNRMALDNPRSAS